MAKNDTEALLDYMNTLNEFNKRMNEYFPVNRVLPGQKMKVGKTITNEIILELDKLEKDVEKKHRIWMKLVRK